MGSFPLWREGESELQDKTLQYNVDETFYKKFESTLLSLSNSVLSHLKSLYRLLTDDSLTLKIGRFVCQKKW